MRISGFETSLLIGIVLLFAVFPLLPGSGVIGAAIATILMFFAEDSNR